MLGVVERSVGTGLERPRLRELPFRLLRIDREVATKVAAYFAGGASAASSEISSMLD